MNSPVRPGVSPATSTSTGVFNQRFEALFPRARTLSFEVCLTPQLLLPVYLHADVGPLGLLAAALPRVLSARLPVSSPPTSLDDCFFFNSLVVGLPCSSIFCQFWLFFVFKFVVVLLLFKEAQCVHLLIHLGQKSPPTFLISVALELVLKSAGVNPQIVLFPTALC